MDRVRSQEPNETRTPTHEPRREPNIDLDEVYTDTNGL
jgi:hypothetical protein